MKGDTFVKECEATKRWLKKQGWGPVNTSVATTSEHRTWWSKDKYGDDPCVALPSVLTKTDEHPNEILVCLWPNDATYTYVKTLADVKLALVNLVL